MRSHHINEILKLLSRQISQTIRNQIKCILAHQSSPFDFADFYTKNGYLSHNNFKLYMTTGRCLQEMNRHTEALAIYRRIQQSGPHVLLTICRCLQEMNRHTEALSVYNQMNPHNPQVLLSKRCCLQEMNRHSKTLSPNQQENTTHSVAKNNSASFFFTATELDRGYVSPLAAAFSPHENDRKEFIEFSQRQ